MLLQGPQDPAERRETAERIRSEHIDALKQAHRDTFPLSDNLMPLIFLVQSDLNEQQRERFVASMALRQINMNNYTYLGVKGLFLDLFCGTATGTADPSIRRQRRSTFLVLDEGDLEEESGYWVMDQETGEEGFVSLFSESEFWVLAAKGGYTRRRIHGRMFRKPSKGGKGKGRGKGRRPGFVSTIPKKSGRQMKPLGTNGHTLRTDRRTDRKMKSTIAQSKGLTR